MACMLFFQGSDNDCMCIPSETVKIARICLTGRGVVTIADDVKGQYLDGITAVGTITPGS